MLLKLKSYLDEGISVVSFRKLNADYRMDRIGFISYSGDAFGNMDEGSFFQGELNTLMHPEWKYGNGIQYIPSARASYYFHYYRPKPRIFIFGAGPDAKPFVQFASHAGFAVTLCDWREALCCREHFPQADEFIVGSLVETASIVRFGPHDAVVLMTHHFQYDRMLMEVLLQRDLFYLGILGPKKENNPVIGRERYTKLCPFSNRSFYRS